MEAPERIPWVRPILDPDESLLADIHAALSSGRVTNDGPNLREFERRLASYLGAEDCVAVSSGSAALLLAIWALDLRGGTAVLPSFTFLATLNPIVLAGMTPVFCDIEPDTWTLSPVHLNRLLAADPSIRLVVPVNVFGVHPDLGGIRHAIVGLRSLQVLEATLARRREYAERLRRTMAADCADVFSVQVIPRGMRSNFQNLGVLCRRSGHPNVQSIQTALDRAGIETRRYFWPPLHQLPAYRGRCTLPVTDAVGEAILCLP